MIDNSTPELARYDDPELARYDDPELARYDDSEPVYVLVIPNRAWRARRDEPVCNARLGDENAGLQCTGDRYCILVASHPSGITHTAPDGTTW